MKNRYARVLMVLLFLVSSTALKSNDISLDWGKPIAEIKGTLVPNGESIGGCDGYVNLEEDYNFLGITAHSITYGFCNNKLASVSVGMFNKDLSSIVGYLTTNYDKPEISMDNGVVTYRWNSKGMSAVLFYDKSNGKGVDLTMVNTGGGAVAAQAVTSRRPARNAVQQPVYVPEPEPEPLPPPCPTESLYDGFKCKLWGTPFDEMDATLTEYKGKSSGKMDDYEMKDDDLMYDDLKTSTTIYSFKNGLFQGATMAMYNKDIDKIVDLWTDEYGKPRVVDGAGFFTNYEWHLDGLLLTITYIHEKEDGIGVLAGIVCENDNFKVRDSFISGSRSRSNRSSGSAVEEDDDSDSGTRSSARDRRRRTTDDEKVSKSKDKAEEAEEEVSNESTGTKSKRELMRERKEKK